MIDSTKYLDGPLGTVGLELGCSSLFFPFFSFYRHIGKCAPYIYWNITHSKNVEMDCRYMFKICQIFPSHSISKQIMFRFAIAPTATQITMNWADSWQEDFNGLLCNGLCIHIIPPLKVDHILVCLRWILLICFFFSYSKLYCSDFNSWQYISAKWHH